MRASRLAVILVALSGAAIARDATARPSSTIAKAPKGKSASSRVDRSTVGVGDLVTYTVSISLGADDPEPVAASPGAVDGFVVLGKPSTSTSVQMSMGPGGVQRSTLANVIYRLRAKSTGTYSLGPAVITFSDGTEVKAPKVTVAVVAAGAAPTPPSPFADPFSDPFFDTPPFPDDDEPPTVPKIEAADPMAKVTAPPTDPAERSFFVRLVADKAKAVVGEQITVKVFAYARTRRNSGLKHQPGFADFAMVDLGDPDTDAHRITIGDEIWSYLTLGSWAVFPLHAGRLAIAPAQIESAGVDPFGMSTGPVVTTSTAQLDIDVVEPPIDGRPTDYRVGDVASFLTVAAEVSPRQSDDGHVSLTVRMKGRGRFGALAPVLPDVDGMKATETSSNEKTEPTGLVVTGARRDTFDLSFAHPGTYALGDAKVIVWDPIKNAYATVAAPLGSITVTNVTAAAPSTSSTSALDELPPPRDDVGPSGDGESLADRGWTWGLVAAAPLGVVIAQGAAALVRRTKKRRAEAKAKPESQAEAALREAREAASRGDDKAKASAMTKALDRAIEAATGVRPRGLTQSELTRSLVEARLPRDLATRAATLFSALEAARFAGGAPPSLDEVTQFVTAVSKARRAS